MAFIEGDVVKFCLISVFMRKYLIDFSFKKLIAFTYISPRPCVYVFNYFAFH